MQLHLKFKYNLCAFLHLKGPGTFYSKVDYAALAAVGFLPFFPVFGEVGFF